LVPPICQAILLLGACVALKTHRCRFTAVRGGEGAIRQSGCDWTNDKFVAVALTEQPTVFIGILHASAIEIWLRIVARGSR